MIRHNILASSEVAQQFIHGVQLLKDPAVSPWPGQEELSMYDFFVFWHHRAMMLSTPPTQTSRNAAHEGPVFLPWHRYMLLRFEQFLQDALDDGDFRLPYWNWGTDAELEDPTTSAIWSADLLGQFELDSFVVRLEPNPSGENPRIVSRELDRSIGSLDELPSRSAIRDVVHNEAVYDSPNYDRFSASFRNLLEGWRGPQRLHNNVHVWVGGDMLASTSPNDPVFFLHHCNVDRIWAAWQALYPQAEYQPQQSASDDLLFHRIDDPMHTFFEEEVTPRDMLDHTAFYEYDTLVDITTVSPPLPIT